MSIVEFKFDTNTSIRTVSINNLSYFIVSDICNALSLTNPSSAISRIDDEDKIKIDPKLYLGSASNQALWAVNESGLYFLIFKSKRKEAVKFKKWITKIVLPSIRKYGSYSVFSDNTMVKHLNNEEQKSNSKLINSKKYRSGGVDAVINHNRLNCEIHTGKTTKFIKEWGKSNGLKSKDYQSAKSVLRKTHPQVACAMSFADSILYHNPDKTLDDIKSISLSAIKVFDEMIKIGLTPIELTNNDN